MVPRVDVISVQGPFAASDASALAERLDAAFAGGARWVAVDLAGAGAVEARALATAARRPGVVVCGGPDALLVALTDAGVIATRRLLDVRIAARAQDGDALKRRLELLGMPPL